MGYKLLGWATWNGAKWFLRRKYGSTTAPAPVLAAAAAVALAAAVGVAVAARRNGGD
jgi:hypothetical protein